MAPICRLSAKTSKKGTSAISILTTQYGDNALYGMIESAMKTTGMKDLATRLQAEQFEHWVAIGKDPDEVFHLFKLDEEVKDMFDPFPQVTYREAGRRLFNNPEFTIWTKYVGDLNAKHPEEPASMVPTLRKYFSEDDLLKMAETGMQVEKTKRIATMLENDLVHMWQKDRKTPYDALVAFGLGGSAETLLKSPLFNTWVKYIDTFNTMNPYSETTMIEVLTRRFGDEEVARMISAAKSEDATTNIATKLESAELKMWLNNGKSVDDVYELLKLFESVNGFAHDPLLSTWVSYMNTVIMKPPSKASALLSALKNRFSDRSLNQILEAAKNFPSMEEIATKMQKENIQRAFDSKKSPAKVFEAVGLGDDATKVLGNPLFKKWLNYVEIFDKENPNHQESWFMSLHRNYRWNEVERMIKDAEENPSTAKIAEMVETAWLRVWLETWKEAPKTAFRSLYLNKAGEKSLSSPKFKIWVKYLDDFNDRYPDEKTTVIDSLRANYKDRELLEIFDASKKDQSTKKLAATLEDDLLNKWVAEKTDPALVKSVYELVPNSDEIVKRYNELLNARKYRITSCWG